MRRSVLLVMLLTAIGFADVLPTAAQSDTKNSVNATSGRALVCAATDFKFETSRELRLPATTIFRDAGPLKGDIRAPWDINGISDSSKWAAFATTDSVTLTKAMPCTEVGARMLVSSLYKASSANPSDNRVWHIHDVISYELSARNPPTVEFGRLVDDIVVKAKITSELVDLLSLAPSELDKTAKAKICRENARAVATKIRGNIEHHTNSRVVISHPEIPELAYHCDEYGERPYLVVAWSQAKPTAAISENLSKAGAYFLGTTPERIRSLFDKCFFEALRPEFDGLATKEIDGVRMECHAYFKKMGVSSITLYRRFGKYPSLTR